MSIDILRPYLKPIADAIRSKKGTTESINAQNFATEIANLPSGGGGNNNVIEVSELPTENIDESKIYLVNKVSNIEVYYHDEVNYYTLADLAAAALGGNSAITYYLVDALPETPLASDLATFSVVHCYIYNDIAYLYGNAGSGNMWLPLSALVSQIAGTTVIDKGRTLDISTENGDIALYVYYDDKQIGSTQKNGMYAWNGENWRNNSVLSKKFKDIINGLLQVLNKEDIMGIIQIRSYAFYGFKLLTSVVIPESVTLIGESAFAYCFSLSSVVIPNSVTVIERQAFEHCTSLTSVVIPNGVTSIRYRVFHYCQSLSSVVIPESVTSIDDEAFYYCSNLTSIVIPEGVTSIGEYAFSDCIVLTDITFNGTVAQWNAITKGAFWNLNVPATKVVCTDGEVSL